MVEVCGVIGKASAQLKTDLVKIAVSITTKEMQAAKALSNNKGASDEALVKIKSLGINLQNITTSQFSVNPSYNFTYGQVTSRVFDGYEVRNGLDVLISDLALAGNLIDSLINIKGLEINAVSFLVSREKIKQTEDMLLDEAIQDANNKAQIAAKRFNLGIKMLKKINIGSVNSGQQRFPMINTFAKASAAPTLLGNNEEVSVEVELEYQIG